MRPLVIVVLLVLLFVVAAGVAVRCGADGFSARAKPSAMEAYLARHVRRLAMPYGARRARNPVQASPEVLARARLHFADHCAQCHANDGSGETQMGRSMYPPAPDMRQGWTQSLSDGELYYIIRNGIRFTGMPAWGGENSTEDGQTWELVHFLRRLSEMTPAELREMEKANPKSRHEIEEELEIERFLGDGAPAQGAEPPLPHGGSQE